MSERGVGAVEREALDRCRDAEVAGRRAYFARLELVAELERLGVAQVTGDRSTERLLQDLLTVDLTEARRLVGDAADLTPRVSLQGQPLPPRLPATATVLAAGEVGAGHVIVIRTTMNRLAQLAAVDAAAWAAAEVVLAEQATRLPPTLLQRVAQRLIVEFDPDGAAPPEGEDRFDELHVARRGDGSLALRGRLLDPVDGEVFWEVIDALATPTGPDDDRSRARRHADALKELAQAALGPGGLVTDTRRDPAHPEPSRDDEPGAGDAADDGEVAVIPAPRRAEPRRPEAPAAPVRGPGRAQLTITMDHRWLQLAVGYGTLDSGALSDPATVRRWACDAEILPVVLGSGSQPLDVGRLSRTVPDAIRRALDLRDGGCAFPGCTRRPRRCHAHHLQHWADGGPTSLDNLVLLCRHHHQLIHHAHWVVEIHQGIPWFTPPPWIDPDRQPRLGGRPPVPL